MTYDLKVREAAARAADWLEAHPDRHIMVHIALNDNGQPVASNDPKACSFCALGRLAHELGIDAVKDGDYLPMRELLGGSRPVAVIYTNNDRSKLRGIACLRDVANDVPLA